MPIKLPKGFNRRKSSGNALEENPNPPQPSFRVFERPSDGSKSFDGGIGARRRSEIRPYSEGQSLDYLAGKEKSGSNRGSAGTQHSTSSSRLYDTSASSVRLSSSSTLPSSSSLEAAKDDQPSRSPRNAPAPPPVPTTPSGFSLLGSSRTFSFGARKATQAVRQLSSNNVAMPEQTSKFSDIPDVEPAMRPRAMTETSHASTSTATPPKLFDAELSLPFTDEPDGFGTMFDGFDLTEKRESRGVDGRQNQRSLVESSVHPDTSGGSTFAPPPPVHVDRFRSITPAPHSAASQNSRDGLISSSPQHEHSSHDTARAVGPKVAALNRRSKTFDSSPSSASKPLMRNAEQSARDSYQIANEDARLVMEYMNQSQTRKASPPVKRKPAPDTPKCSSQDTPVVFRETSRRNSFELGQEESIHAAPREKMDQSGLEDDLAFQEMARSAAQYESGRISPTKAIPASKGKVMTPAQFERYRKEQESHRVSFKSEDSDDGDDNYSEDDEEERAKEMVKQRKKQEAQLAVYRQQMMKVTGEHQPLNRPVSSLQPPGSDRSVTSPNLGARKSVASLRDRAAASKSSDEEEDEDIPLGILAAHGFPSKERPPSHLQRSSSQPTIHYSSDTYPPPAPPGSGLPAFARNLPKDPYYGASIVNPSNRESLAFGSGAASVYGGSQAGGAPNLPPGGLVGVIAKEERQRAMRRGSPSSQAFDASNMAGGLPAAMMPSAFAPDQQAQMQMSHQMTQMMQMQMQWMQQMMAMQGMQAGQQMPPMPAMPGMPTSMSMPSMPGVPPMPTLQIPPQPSQPQSLPTTPLQSLPTSNQQRPTSTGSAFASGQRQSQGRAVSMLSPDGQAQWNRTSRASAAPSVLFGNRSQQPGAGPRASQYAPSIAPSERSNVGQPSRYRPVSTMPDDRKSRASTMGSGALLAWDAGRSGEKDKAGATVRMVERKGDDEDDEEGWEEMKRKMEGKRKLWRGKKGQKDEDKGLESVFYPVEA